MLSKLIGLWDAELYKVGKPIRKARKTLLFRVLSLMLFRHYLETGMRRCHGKGEK
jgi:hypothetical protein